MLSALALACLLPAAPWPTATPEEVGLRPLALEAFSRYVGGRGCLVRHGRMVYTWGDATTPGDVASAAKPVYAHFLFKALEQGRIASVDGAVAALEPRLSGADAGITWRHLATQTSCYGVAEAPGTAYCYNDWQMALFWDLLFLKVYESDYEHVDEQVLHPLLTDPLGCEDRPTLMAFGTGNRPGRLAISPRDFARFGMLYLHGGEFGGQRLLREDLARLAVSEPLPNELPQSTGEAAPLLPGQRSLGSTRVPDNQTDHLGSYSWLWWLNGVDRDGLRHWPSAPADTFGCFGHGGKRVMAVLKGLDLIVSWNDSTVASREAENEAFRWLVAATR